MPAKRKPPAAILSAASIEVGCPWCGEAQSEPALGSHLWAPHEIVAARDQPRNCISCHEPYRIARATHVILPEG